MRNYVFRTGLFSAITAGLALIRALREEEFTWRTAVAWISWGASLALAIGAIVDTRRATKGHLAPRDSPVSGREKKLLKKRVTT